MTDVWIGVSESGDRLTVYDGQTDEEILPDQERAEKKKERAEREKARAEKAEAELRRLMAMLEKQETEAG